MSNHTPEPWSINEWPQGDAEIRIGAVGYPRIAAVLLKYESINGQKANAERIVACVNACAGIDPEAIPLLMEALRDLIPHVLHYAAMPLAHSDAHKHAAQARAAIKLATGKLP